MAIIGESRITNSILRMMGEDARSQIDDYISNVCSKNFLVMKSMEQVYDMFGDNFQIFMESLSEEELMDLRSYTGYNFKNINAILRGNWEYDVNGSLTPEKKEEFRKLADSVGNIVSKFNMPNVDFITFRGTTLSSFSSYGISELAQLESLNGKFLYEQGFTSTSILEDSCYFNKKLDTGKNYNVEIRYLISSECNDGALLIDKNTTYSTSQNEFLLNKGALSKVIDVKIDKNTNTAILTVVLVPREVYDLTQKKGEVRNK